MNDGISIGIDASNLRGGGGRTHLIELLRSAVPAQHGVGRVVVWGSRSTLALLDDQPWLEKRNPDPLERGLLSRVLWQRFSLAREARESRCDLLFVPGGSYAGDFHPVVSMSQNMLPFEWKELRRYGVSVMTLRMLLLRLAQARSFRASEGVVFLTEYARDHVTRITGRLRGQLRIIPHGLNPRFIAAPRAQRSIDTYTEAQPFTLVYISIVDQYKHQWALVEAVGRLRQATGWPISLQLIGPAYPPALKRLRAALAQWDPDGAWAHYQGPVPFDQLHRSYCQADLGVFASSCENMPNILLETMAAGLPVVSSNKGPMPGMLGDAGLYFDPEFPAELVETLRRVIESPQLREELAAKSFAAAQAFSWSRCAAETFAFLSEVCQAYQAKNGTGVCAE